MSKILLCIILTHKLNEIFMWLKCVYNIYLILTPKLYILNSYSPKLNKNFITVKM